MDEVEPTTQEYCDNCGELVTAEDEDSDNFYCDCGNEWSEGDQHAEYDENDDDEN